MVAAGDQTPLTVEESRLDGVHEGIPHEIQQKQIEQYVELFRLFDEYSDIIERVSLWNLHDGQAGSTSPGDGLTTRCCSIATANPNLSSTRFHEYCSRLRLRRSPGTSNGAWQYPVGLHQRVPKERIIFVGHMAPRDGCDQGTIGTLLASRSTPAVPNVHCCRKSLSRQSSSENAVPGQDVSVARYWRSHLTVPWSLH